jgi:Kef-type K+ transport system membrane component KefB
MALLLYHDCATPLASFTVFALFVGCSMSVTAFPVLARILAEHELLSTKFGLTATACAAMSDVTAWGMLAVVVALGRRAGNVLTLFEHTILGLLVFLVVMFGVVRKLLAALWRRERASARRLSQEALAGVIVLILLSALATELLHLHAIFGAFVAGLVMPPDDALRSMIRSRLEDLLAVLLLPLFFAFTGLRTNIGLLSTGADWALTLGIIALAIAGKCGGTTIAARSMGINWRRAGALGVLMNSRGLIELVLLTIGLQEGIITSRLFTMMFLMAIVTTMMTVPLLKRFVPARAHVD